MRWTINYLGALCPKHPEAAGERREWSGECDLCVLERATERKKAKAARRSARRARRRAKRVAAGLPAIGARRKAHERKVKREWRAANPASCRAMAALRRARKADAAVPLALAEQQCIRALYAEAQRLTRETGEAHHVDHDRPLALGGLHHPNNLLVVPAALNTAKGARYPSTMAYLLS